jgi:hypothetical protein
LLLHLPLVQCVAAAVSDASIASSFSFIHIAAAAASAAAASAAAASAVSFTTACITPCVFITAAQDTKIFACCCGSLALS